MQCVCTPCHHLYCNAVAIRSASASNPIIAPPQFNGDWCGVAFISWFLTRHSLLHEFIKNGSGNSFSLHHPAFIGRPRRPDLPDQVKPLAIRHAYAEWGSWPAVLAVKEACIFYRLCIAFCYPTQCHPFLAQCVVPSLLLRVIKNTHFNCC